MKDQIEVKTRYDSGTTMVVSQVCCQQPKVDRSGILRCDGTRSTSTSPSMTMICRILSSKAIQPRLSSPVEEERSSSTGRRRVRSEGHGVCARQGSPTCKSQKGSSGQAYRQRCDRPLRVQENGRHRRTLVIAEPNRLLLLGDQDAYTGPMIMPQSLRRCCAQGHYAYILCGEWYPCLEVVSNDLSASVGPGKGIG
jgi:hypothetical protein